VPEEGIEHYQTVFSKVVMAWVLWRQVRGIHPLVTGCLVSVRLLQSTRNNRCRGNQRGNVGGLSCVAAMSWAAQIGFRTHLTACAFHCHVSTKSRAAAGDIARIARGVKPVS